MISGVGAVPTLERGDSDGDGAEELAVGWASLADEAAAAVQSGTAGLSCPAGMVLREGLCRTPKVETVAVTWVCPQAGDGYELVVGLGELGVSHSCQKTVPAHCTGGKILHEGQCRTRTVTENVETRDPVRWECSEGTLETTFLDPGYSRRCRVTLDSPRCGTGETYRTAPRRGCYVAVTEYATKRYDGYRCPTGYSLGHDGMASTCSKSVSPPQCPNGETYRTSPRRGCYEEDPDKPTRPYRRGCPSRYTLSYDGIGWTCTMSVPPYCTGALSYRTSPTAGCYRQGPPSYATKAYRYRCPSGYSPGHDGMANTCSKSVSPPQCPGGETYRTSPRRGCYEAVSVYATKRYDGYRCPSGYSLGHDGMANTCSKTETYRVRRCAFDPVAGQQCWYETRTRTLTQPATPYCGSGYSDDGTQCVSDTATTEWRRTTSQPVTTLTRPATPYCGSGYSDNGSRCVSDTATPTWIKTTAQPQRTVTAPVIRDCPRGYSDNGAECEADIAWRRTTSQPITKLTRPATPYCGSGYSDDGTQCVSDTATTRWDVTANPPTLHVYRDAVPVCDGAGFAWDTSRGKCAKPTTTTTYSDPTAPLTKTVGRSPMPLCADGYDPAGAGQCSRTVLGPPTVVPDGAGCITGLGTLTPGNVSRSGILAAGCVSLVKGDEQSPHWARRFSLAVGAASTATFTASSAAVDVFVSVLSGSDSAITVVASDDDLGAGTDAKVSGVALAPGVTYTVEVTTSIAGPTGAFALTGTIALAEPPVVISGLADDTETGNGTVTASAEFTVEPADAVCTAATAATGAKPKIAAGSAADKRVVSLAGAVPFSHIVTVRCDAAGRTAAQAAVTLAGTPPAVSITGFDDSTPVTPSTAYASDKITVEPSTARCSGTAAGHGVGTPWVSSRTSTRTVVARVQPGGAATVTVTCTAAGHSPASAQALFSYTPRPQITSAATFAPKDACTAVAPDRRTDADADADAVWQCSLDEGAALAATLTVVAGTYRVSDAWNTTGGITAKVRTIPAPVPVIGPDNAATDDWRTTAAATLRCTTDGAVAAVLTAGRRPGHRTHTTRIRIDCQAPVAISGLDNATGYGKTGTAAAVAEDFAVEPADATCTAAPTGTVTAPDPARPHVRRLTAGIDIGTTAAITVSCTADRRADSTQDVVLSGEVPALSVVVSGQTCVEVSPVPRGADGGYRCVLSDKHRLAVTATADASLRAVSLGWSASGGATVAARRSDEVAAVAAPGGELTGIWRAVGTAGVECSADGDLTLTVTLGSGAAALTHTSVVAVDCEPQGAVVGLEDAAGAGTGEVTVAGGFTVAPAAASCTAQPAAARVTAGIGGYRTVSLGLSAVPGQAASAVVRVDCTPPGHAPVTATATFTASYTDTCDDPLGVLGAGATTRSGTIAQNAACTSPQRPRDGASSARYWARRHTFTLANPATLRIDAASPTRRGLDVYVLLLDGRSQDGTGTVLGRDNNSGAPRRGARLTGVRLAPGDYTIEVTTANKRRTGAYDLRVEASLGVLINRLDGNSIIGTGTAVDSFAVVPHAAKCTPSAGTVTDLGDGQRVLTADLTTLGSTEVTVTCTHPGYRTAAAASTLTALDPIDDVTVAAAADGSCTKTPGPPSTGIDSQYACTMTRGGQMTLRAEVTGPSSQTTLGWAAAAGVRAVPSLGDLDASVVGDTVTFTRTGTAKVTCNADGHITITAKTGLATHHTTRIAVTCQPPVQISDYTPGTRNGPGPVTGTYNVAPATAHCTPRNVGGITGTPAPGGTGTSRTVNVTTTATGWLDVEVECSNTGYATSTATARFRADDQAACSTDLGVLWHGSIARTGTLSTASCVSDKRTPSSGTFYADRYTFTMATAGWVSVDVEGTGAGAGKLDTYLVVLYGHGSGGVERSSDDDSGGDGDARVADVLLAAGRYTIEATTASNGAVGGYRLRVQGDFAVRAPDQPSRTIATVGQQTARTWAHQPPTAAVTVQSVTPDGLDVSVVSDDGQATLTASPTRAGDYTVTVAYTASGHTSTKTTVIDADCPPRHIETDTRTCTPLATSMPTGCTPTPLHDGFVWGDFEHDDRANGYGDSAGPDCDALSQSAKAAYYRFDLPAGLSGRFALRALNSGGTASYLFNSAGAPSMTLWRITGAHPAIGTQLDFVAMSQSTRSSEPRLDLSLSAGAYVVELAPSIDVQINARIGLRSVLPLGADFYDDVRLVGNVGLDGDGMTLGQFLDARGTDYVHHPDPTRRTDEDDFHDPLNPKYPWLAFWTDRCSIPRVLSSLNLKDYPKFGGVEVPFVYGCMRHDFNWRNLYRAEHYYDHVGENPDGPWRVETFHESNGRLGLDLVRLCNVNGSPENPDPESPLFTWNLRRRAPVGYRNITSCENTANEVKFGVGLVLLIFDSWTYEAK